MPSTRTLLALHLAAGALALTMTACAGVVVDESSSSSPSYTGVPAHPCDPSAAGEVCYGGPANTEGIGLCKAGTQVCNDDGAGGECAGEVRPGAEVCATAADESCDGDGACTGKLQWARDGEDAGGDRSGADIAADPWGNVLVTGRFKGSLHVAGLALESEDYAAFVMKLDPAGKGLWAQKSTGNADGRAIASDAAGNVYVAGSFLDTVDLGGGPMTSAGAYDLLVAKYDPSGELLWSKQLGGPGFQWAERMAVDAAGNVAIIGGIHDGADFGDGYQSAYGATDFFVLELDASGEKQWSSHFGTPDYDYGLGIAFDEEGAVIIAGSFDGTLHLGGEPLVTAGSDDIFLAKLSPAGKHVFSRRIGGSGPDLAKGLAVDPAGNAMITGLSTGLVDFGGGELSAGGVYDAFLARYDLHGAYLGAQVFGGPGASVQGLGVAADGAGNVVIFGMMAGTAGFGGEPLSSAGSGSGSTAEDLFVAKYDPAGKPVYSYVFGDAERQWAHAVAVDAAGSALLAGQYQGTLDFGSGPLVAPPPQDWDLFIAKLAP